MGVVTIEEKGGFVGAGMPGGHVHTRGEMAWDALSQADRATIDTLFAAKRPVNANLYYRLSRSGPAGTEAVDALREAVPAALLARVKTTLD
ncbi:hypothetical protein [Novosphingobium sp.]|uniref:hypothetical protein n=1 Tax=Novosphingobium sp. TaxID=1874826 RepID=UPI0025F70E15|nr:hypothetical protein [Novosphingobium sp.]